MKKVIWIICILSIVALSSFALTYSTVRIGSATLTYAATFIQPTLNASVATVVRVKDGDTIVVDVATLTNVTVRLLGVDTPEDVDPRKPVQYFSLQAASFTRYTLTGKRVYLTYGENRYGVFHRMLAYVWMKTPKGYVMFNALLIINGYGKYYPKYKFRRDYMILFNQFQQYAKAHQLGMWTLPKMVGKADALQIINVHYNGSDEYVQIKNVSHKTVNLRGWKLTSIPIDKQVYKFPDILLEPKESVYVCSGRNAGVKKLDGINLVWTKAYIWNNKGDTCRLINSSGETVGEFSY